MADWSPVLTAILGVLTVFTLMIAVVLIAVLRHLAFLTDVMNPMMKFRTASLGPASAEPLPSIGLKDIGGRSTTSDAVIGGEPTILFVVQKNCAPCRQLLSAIRDDLQRASALGWRTVLVVRGRPEDAVELLHEYALGGAVTALADSRQAVSDRWSVDSTPFGLVLDSDGHVHQKFAVPNPTVIAELLRGAPADHFGTSEGHNGHSARAAKGRIDLHQKSEEARGQVV